MKKELSKILKKKKFHQNKYFRTFIKKTTKSTYLCGESYRFAQDPLQETNLQKKRR